jgi:hypothetical protein
MRLDIWPELPIVIEVKSSNNKIDDDVIAALKHNDRICEIYAKQVPWSHLEKLVELMQVPFPALTHLCLPLLWDTSSPNLPDSFLGGSAPLLRSLDLSNIAFPALPGLLISATGLVHLSFLFTPAFSVEVMLDCLSSLIGLEKLHVNFERCLPNASRRQPPPTRSVLPMLNSLSFRGTVEVLEDLYARIEAPLLKYVHINLSDPVIFDVSTILPFIGHKEAFEALNQAHMVCIYGIVEVTLSSRNGTSGDMILILSLESSDPGWRLRALTRDHRPSPLADFDRLGYLLPKDRDKVQWPRVDIGNTRELLRFFAFVERLYLSNEVAIHVVPTLAEVADEEGGVTEVLPALQGLFVDRMRHWELDYEAVRRFVSSREVSGHPVCIQNRLWTRGDE